MTDEISAMMAVIEAGTAIQDERDGISYETD